MSFCKMADQVKYPFVLPELPFGKDSLEPFMSAKTFDFHHAKHHNAYVVNLNKLLELKVDLQDKSLEELVVLSAGKSEMAGVFNNAAQIWNHTFFWHCLKKDQKLVQDSALMVAIVKSFGSYEKFVEEFKNGGVSQFGSGWVWLVKDADGKLSIVKTSNAETPITKGLTPILTCDVWEHAYYIDFQNRRPDFLQTFLDNLVNWEFATEQFGR